MKLCRVVYVFIQLKKVFYAKCCLKNEVPKVKQTWSQLSRSLKHNERKKRHKQSGFFCKERNRELRRRAEWLVWHPERMHDTFMESLYTAEKQSCSFYTFDLFLNIPQCFNLFPYYITSQFFNPIPSFSGDFVVL